MDPLPLALIYASRDGSLDTVNALLEYIKSKPSSKYIINYVGGPASMPALIYASMNGHLRVVETLLKAGANANQPAFDKNTTALMFASFTGHLDVVRTLLEAGANVNAVTTEGMTALMYASMNRHLPVARLLIQNNADPALKNKDGQFAEALAGEFWKQIITMPASPSARPPAFGGRRKKSRRNRNKRTHRR